MEIPINMHFIHASGECGDWEDYEYDDVFFHIFLFYILGLTLFTPGWHRSGLQPFLEYLFIQSTIYWSLITLKLKVIGERGDNRENADLLERISGLSIDESRVLILLLLLYCHLFLTSDLLIYCSCVGYINIYICYMLSLVQILYHNMMTFFMSYYRICLKSVLSDKYVCPCYFIISVCMEYLFHIFTSV